MDSLTDWYDLAFEVEKSGGLLYKRLCGAHSKLQLLKRALSDSKETLQRLASQDNVTLHDLFIQEREIVHLSTVFLKARISLIKAAAKFCLTGFKAAPPCARHNIKQQVRALQMKLSSQANSPQESYYLGLLLLEVTLNA